MLFLLVFTLVYQRPIFIALRNRCYTKPDIVTTALILCHYCVTTYDAMFTNTKRAYKPEPPCLLCSSAPGPCNATHAAMLVSDHW